MYSHNDNFYIVNIKKSAQPIVLASNTSAPPQIYIFSLVMTEKINSNHSVHSLLIVKPIVKINNKTISVITVVYLSIIIYIVFMLDGRIHPWYLIHSDLSVSEDHANK